MTIELQQIIDFAHTPSGAILLNILLVYLLAEFFGRQLIKQLMILTNFSRNKENAIILLGGKVLNVSYGILITQLTGYDIILGIWFIMGSLLLHYIHVKYLDKIIKKKYGIK